MSQELSGRRILVVEDEYFLADEIEDALVRAGADVIGPLGNVDDAMRQVEGNGFDLAVLDINLGGDLAYPIADALNEQGVPFIFASAYTPSDVPLRHRNRTLVEKPFRLSTLIGALVKLIARPAGALQEG